MTKTTLLATLMLGATLAGCSTGAPTAIGQGTRGAVGVVSEAPTVTMVGRFAITGANGFRLLSTEKAFNLADVHQVVLKLQKSSGDATGPWADVSGATKTIANAELANNVPLNNLRMNTHYKVVAQAFDSAGARLDNAVAADNETTFQTPALVSGGAHPQTNTTSADTVSTAASTFTIKVKLKNKTFSGTAQAGSGVAVTNGTIVDTTATESF